MAAMGMQQKVGNKGNKKVVKFRQQWQLDARVGNVTIATTNQSGNVKEIPKRQHPAETKMMMKLHKRQSRKKHQQSVDKKRGKRPQLARANRRNVDSGQQPRQRNVDLDNDGGARNSD